VGIVISPAGAACDGIGICMVEPECDCAALMRSVGMLIGFNFDAALKAAGLGDAALFRRPAARFTAFLSALFWAAGFVSFCFACADRLMPAMFIGID
jgi:hypothetical protein